jgi:hypothetical protein
MSVKIGRCDDVRCTTALPPKAEVRPRSCYVANVPKPAVSRCSNMPCAEGRIIRSPHRRGRAAQQFVSGRPARFNAHAKGGIKNLRGAAELELNFSARRHIERAAYEHSSPVPKPSGSPAVKPHPAGDRHTHGGRGPAAFIASRSLSSASVTPRASSLGAPPLRQAAPLQQGRRALHWRRFTSLRHLRGAISRRGHDQLSALKPFVGSVRPLWRRKDIHARHHLHDLPPSRPRRSDCVSDRGYLMTPCSGIERVTSVWLSSWAGGKVTRNQF